MQMFLNASLFMHCIQALLHQPHKSPNGSEEVWHSMGKETQVRSENLCAVFQEK